MSKSLSDLAQGFREDITWTRSYGHGVSKQNSMTRQDCADAVEAWLKGSQQADLLAQSKEELMLRIIALQRQVEFARHHYTCNYWKWDFNFSWHQTDCTCPPLRFEYAN